MRLIDADALKEEVNKKNVVGRFNTLLLIDNAPTVCGNNPKWCESCVSKGKCASTRPHGVWARTGQSFVNPNKFRNFCCSNCFWELDEHIRVEPNFCPNCGADMRTKEKTND